MTWNRESHGLFDYENKNIVRNTIQIKYIFKTNKIEYFYKIVLLKK